MELNLSIIVVTYNCSTFIHKFIEELSESLNVHSDYEVLIIDNNSCDNTAACLLNYSNIASVNLLSENIGFARANNILIKKSKYDNILLLNPDVFGFSKIFWVKLFEIWDYSNPLFIKLLNEDLSVQESVGDVSSFKRLFRNLFLKIDYKNIDSKINVEMGIMAFMLLPLEVFNLVGDISEKYHMYAEDMDWCYRARKNHFKLVYDPSLSLVHLGGASAKTKWTKTKNIIVKYESEKIFVDIHYKGIYKLLYKLLIQFKILLCKIK